MAIRVQLVMTERTEVMLNAMYQAPMSRTARGVGFRVRRHILYESIFSSNRLFRRAKNPEIEKPQKNHCQCLI